MHANISTRRDRLHERQASVASELSNEEQVFAGITKENTDALREPLY
ncbi:hypothetical protein RSSM_01084 [Rhodopirellula sallentina SM41]|uniref:Uncharacterized protein n=1 Tax=Rhodopirellula sallentina SM41 TaxID=1263870 RepID=M5U870_9BACT|nr:hypothetical protein RSSM_01084 [Rhodopirellula sallentina SM41]